MQVQSGADRDGNGLFASDIYTLRPVKGFSGQFFGLLSLFNNSLIALFSEE